MSIWVICIGVIQLSSKGETWRVRYLCLMYYGGYDGPHVDEECGIYLSDGLGRGSSIGEETYRDLSDGDVMRDGVFSLYGWFLETLSLERGMRGCYRIFTNGCLPESDRMLDTSWTFRNTVTGYTVGIHEYGEDSCEIVRGSLRSGHGSRGEFRSDSERRRTQRHRSHRYHLYILGKTDVWGGMVVGFVVLGLKGEVSGWELVEEVDDDGTVLSPNTFTTNAEKLVEVFINGLPRSIEGNVTASKPQTLEEAINIAQRLMDQIIKHDSVQEANDHKRKLEDKGNIINNNYQNNYNNNNRNNDHHQQQNRKQETIRTYTATNRLMNNDSLRSEWRKVFHPPRFYQDLKKFYWLSSRGVVLKISRRVKGEGVDLLKVNRTTNLYTINLHEMASASPICLMARATSTKSWLWHQRLSHLNFDTINDLAKNDLNDREDIGKLGAKGDIGFFIGYSATSCMAFEQRSSKLRLQSINSGQISSGLDLTYALSTITSQKPTEHDQAQLQTEIVANDVSNAMLDGNTFVNPFAPPTTSAAESSSSQYVDLSNMHTFYQPCCPHEYQWTKDYPLEQVIGEPSRPVLTRNQLRTDGDMCIYALIVSTIEPRNVKEAMTDPAWIDSMQEELLQFKRLDVWVLVPAPDNIKPFTLKWLFKNKLDKENTVIRNKNRLVVRGYHQEEGILLIEIMPKNVKCSEVVKISKVVKCSKVVKRSKVVK
ncbi:retrovirus-related pol polyprotein from transposon TNT 1-94 [Tanacetum coccineum]